MLYLSVKPINGEYWIHWDQHDDVKGHRRADGEVLGTNRDRHEQAFAELTEIHQWLAIAGITATMFDDGSGLCLRVPGDASAIEEAIGLNLGRRPS
jgi:hypothetical protein